MLANNEHLEILENNLKNSTKEMMEENAAPLLKILMDTEDGNERNKAALILADTAGYLVIKPLINLITDPKTKHSRSTLLYAMENLEYNEYYSFVIDALFDSRWEAQIQALTLLEQLDEKGQSLKMTKKQHALLKEKLNKTTAELNLYLSVFDLMEMGN